jgi:hypothetical protein
MSHEQLLSDSFLATREAEAALRQAVRTDLSRTHGPLWYSLIPEELRGQWAHLEQESKVIGGPDRHAELLDFATLDELGGLINRFADAFEARFDRKDVFQVRLNEFRPLRNALMHGAELSEEDCQRLIRIAVDLSTQCRVEIKAVSRPQDSTGKAEQSIRPRPTPTLNPAQAKLLNVVQQATAQMSGVLLGERDALAAYLEVNRSCCSPEALAYLSNRFTLLPGTAVLVDRLQGEIAPARPERPKADWGVTHWLKWASRFYMPYRRWMIRYGEADSEIDDMALVYEDWLRQHYPKLLLTGDDALVITMYRIVKEQLDKGMRVLWLVIDNLCGLWEADLVGLLLDAGVRIRESRRMLALLPSTTAISRRALLAGRMSSEATHFTDDESACHQLWLEQDVPGVAFCTSIKEAERAASQDKRLLILIDNRLDTLAHQPEEPGFDRSEEMLLKMRSLATKVSALLRQMNAVAPTRLVIGTDHGAIYPGPNSQIIAVPPSAIFDEDADRHQRFSIIRDSLGLNSVDWHVLSAESYGLPWTCAVARGQRFIGKRLKAYTHGGLSPEETVVKLLIADIGEREPLELVLSQATPPMRLGRAEQLAILVRNPFDVPVENLELALPQMQVRFASLDVPPHSEAETDEQTVTLPAKAEIRDGVTFLFVMGRFEIAGKASLMQQYLRVRVHELYRSAMDDFGDLLNG